MGQILHGSATTGAVRRAIQNSQESLMALAKRYSINPKTVAKWKKRTSISDLIHHIIDRGGGHPLRRGIAGDGNHRRE